MGTFVQTEITTEELDSLITFAWRRHGTIGTIWRTPKNLYAFVEFRPEMVFDKYFLYHSKTKRGSYWKRVG